MEEIPAIDLKRQYQSIRKEIDEAYARVMSGGSFILGTEVAAFEKEFAEYCGVSYAIGVASGTEALQLALMACGIEENATVLTTAHTAVATVGAIEASGAYPKLLDIDLSRYTLDPAELEKSINDQTCAIIPVHLYGCSANMRPILDVAKEKKLFVIEDASQAHGALYFGHKVGAMGHAAAFSFYPTKNLGAFGDGGAVLTNDSGIAERVRLLRQYGWKEHYVSSVKGINSRLDELQAAILRVKLRHLDEWNQRRNQLADLYFELLADTDLVLPLRPDDCEHVFHQFVIRHPRRDALREYLRSKGIHTLIHYPVPIHLQPAYKNLGLNPGDLPKAEQAAREMLSLPIYPELTEREVRRVAEAVRSFF
ncbi:MAG TPA: DegT/DnrJ/EryC1/StrS family aminotransferase [Anaerolineales bacterium]|nr:DegT/DnrJ/EryC1/StrS family aminotransferase [Anaerolineales bacterium]